ncbi:Protein FAM49A [Eumeta japonica]|uniref:Protein FAM49A n=1 Tax=Eumeta variegata TaxID=151549 RepID=A0A4C1YY98_EUMVA|nr:Protein FAM49A [Eumeta japonica]
MLLRALSRRAQLLYCSFLRALFREALLALIMVDRCYLRSKLVAQFSREETSLLVLRVMVGLIILYDWVHPAGAFCRSSSVDVKGCVKFLQQQPAAKAEPLLNALR